MAFLCLVDLGRLVFLLLLYVLLASHRVTGSSQLRLPKSTLARLDIKGDKIAIQSNIKFGLVRLTAGSSGIWLVKK